MPLNLTALQSAVDELKTEVQSASPSPVTPDDQAAIDSLAAEVRSLVDELKSPVAGGSASTGDASQPPATVPPAAVSAQEESVQPPWATSSSSS